mgnify:CR=1 FL=1
MKKPRQLERIVKGFANHRRIQILELLNRKPELSVGDITEELDVDFRTVSDHIRRMAVAGLILKRNEGSFVRHVLSDSGRKVLKFLESFE